MIAFRVVSGVTQHFISRLPEWTSAIILFSFGLTLLQPGDTFATSSNFDVMKLYATENVWGYSMAAVGFLRITALIINGTFKSSLKLSVRVRTITSTLSCFAWFTIALGIFLSNPISPGSKTYAILLIVDMILAFHLAIQSAKVDKGLIHGRA